MTPLLAALSSSLVALRSAVVAVAASPLSEASRNRRTAVFSSDFTALLRSRRRSLVRLRLICDLMLATRDLPQVCEGCVAEIQGLRPSSLPASARPQPIQRDPPLHGLELADRRDSRRWPLDARVYHQPGEGGGHGRCRLVLGVDPRTSQQLVGRRAPLQGDAWCPEGDVYPWRADPRPGPVDEPVAVGAEQD